MAEDDIAELLWHNGQIVHRSLIQRPTSDKPSPPPPPPILRGSGSGGDGGEEENSLLLHHQPSDQNLFIQEDEMASWLHHQNFCSDLLYSSDVSTLATQPQVPLTLPPPLSSPYDPPAKRPAAARWPANFMNFSRIKGNVNTGGRVEAGPSIPVVRESTEVGSSATSSSSATESCLTRATHGAETRTMFTCGVSHTSAVLDLGRKEKVVAIETVCENAGTSSSYDSMDETEPIADDRKRKESEENIDAIEGTREARDSTARKRSRASETHNFSEKRRREKINEKMKALQELIPRSNKSDKASMLDDVIEYVKLLQTQLQMMLMGGSTIPMMYPANMQQFMSHMAMGMMGTNQPPPVPFSGIPFPRQAHMVGLGPSYPEPRYHIPTIQDPDPSRVQLLSPQSMSNQPQFPAYMNPYSQAIGLHQKQQPPPSQNQTTSQLSSSQASSRKEPEDQDNQLTG